MTSLSTINPWILLAAAGLLEIVWSVSMKASAGFTKGALTDEPATFGRLACISLIVIGILGLKFL